VREVELTAQTNLGFDRVFMELPDGTKKEMNQTKTFHH
jgi:hypothetical protein